LLAQTGKWNENNEELMVKIRHSPGINQIVFVGTFVRLASPHRMLLFAHIQTGEKMEGKKNKER
jgi:hypothetical protein